MLRNRTVKTLISTLLCLLIAGTSIPGLGSYGTQAYADGEPTVTFGGTQYTLTSSGSGTGFSWTYDSASRTAAFTFTSSGTLAIVDSTGNTRMTVSTVKVVGGGGGGTASRGNASSATSGSGGQGGQINTQTPNADAASFGVVIGAGGGAGANGGTSSVTVGGTSYNAPGGAAGGGTSGVTVSGTGNDAASAGRSGAAETATRAANGGSGGIVNVFYETDSGNYNMGTSCHICGYNTGVPDWAYGLTSWTPLHQFANPHDGSGGSGGTGTGGSAGNGGCAHNDHCGGSGTGGNATAYGAGGGGGGLGTITYTAFGTSNSRSYSNYTAGGGAGKQGIAYVTCVITQRNEIGQVGAGGGWYGGKTADEFDESAQAGGGSGHLGSDVSTGILYDGTQTFKSPEGTSETGHSGNGYARIYYVTDDGLTDNLVSGEFTDTKGTMSVYAPDVTHQYTGTAWTGVLSVEMPWEGATVMYGLEEGSYPYSISPGRTLVGTSTVYYQVTAPSYEPYEGSYTITITKGQVALPVQTGTLYQAGNLAAQTASFTYDSTLATLTGGNSADFAGTYYATFALADTDNYEWPDGTTENKQIPWTITLDLSKFATHSIENGVYKFFEFDSASYTKQSNNYDPYFNRTQDGSCGSHQSYNSEMMNIKAMPYFEWTNYKIDNLKKNTNYILKYKLVIDIYDNYRYTNANFGEAETAYTGVFASAVTSYSNAPSSPSGTCLSGLANAYGHIGWGENWSSGAEISLGFNTGNRTKVYLAYCLPFTYDGHCYINYIHSMSLWAYDSAGNLHQVR